MRLTESGKESAGESGSRCLVCDGEDGEKNNEGRNEGWFGWLREILGKMCGLAHPYPCAGRIRFT